MPLDIATWPQENTGSFRRGFSAEIPRANQTARRIFVASDNVASRRALEPMHLEKALDALFRMHFEEASSALISDTEWASSLSDITQHTKFSEIVSMGEHALRIMLQRMKGGESHLQWFPALKRIAGEDPVPVEVRGKITPMTNAWVGWGNEKGLLEL